MVNFIKKRFSANEKEEFSSIKFYVWNKILELSKVEIFSQIKIELKRKVLLNLGGYTNWILYKKIKKHNIFFQNNKKQIYTIDINIYINKYQN